MREILVLGTKSVHFTFRDVVYLQTDRVAIGSPLGASIDWNIYGWFRKVFRSFTYSKASFL